MARRAKVRMGGRHPMSFAHGRNGRVLIVNYHYICEPRQYLYPGIHPIGVDAFRDQLETLRSNMYMASPDDLEALLYDAPRHGG